jgi:hypothetical protein
MLQVSNAELDANSLRRTDESELLKFFGVIILITKCEFTSLLNGSLKHRHDLGTQGCQGTGLRNSSNV